MLGKMMYTPLLVSDLIKHAARYHGDTPVISQHTDGSTEESDWKTIGENSRSLANALKQFNLEQGDRVATLAWSNRRHLETWYAVSGSGYVCHTINPRLFPEQIAFIVDDAQDKILMFDDSFLELVVALKPHLKSVEHYICMTVPNEDVRQALPEVLFFDDLLRDNDSDFEWPVLDENQPSALCYTSGTTGNPKGVLYSNRTTILNIFAISMPDALGISATDVVLPVAPMFHSNAWGIPYAAAMTGASLILPGQNLDGDSLVDLIDNYKVSVMLGVPTIWKGLIDAALARGSKLTSIKRNGVGGTPCPPAMFRTFQEEFDCDTIHAWGMTEMSPLGTINRPKAKHKDLSEDALLQLRLTQGRPAFGVDLRVVDREDNNRVLPNDGKSQGNLQTRGYSIVDTYFGKQESALEDDGWFDTGDIATIDEDGYVIIRDRDKDLIKSGGEWISSVELEQIALDHPAVDTAVAVGAVHPKWDERPLLIVIPKDDATINETQLIEFFNDKIAKWQIPDGVVFVDEVPISGTGKIDKKKLRDKYKDTLVERGATA